jgi:hypothetical protein
MSSSIKWDDKFFERSGLLIWIYNNGYLESSNEKFYRSNLMKSFRQKQEQGLNNIKLIRLNEREKQ